MNKLLEKAVAEIESLPAGQQELIAARLLDEVRRLRPNRGRWAQVAERLARFDLLKGEGTAFVEQTREFRDRFEPRGAGVGCMARIPVLCDET